MNELWAVEWVGVSGEGNILCGVYSSKEKAVDAIPGGLADKRVMFDGTTYVEVSSKGSLFEIRAFYVDTWLTW